MKIVHRGPDDRYQPTLPLFSLLIKSPNDAYKNYDSDSIPVGFGFNGQKKPSLH